MDNTEGARFGGILVLLGGIVDEECLRGMLITFSGEPDYKLVVVTANIYTKETDNNRNLLLEEGNDLPNSVSLFL